MYFGILDYSGEWGGNVNSGEGNFVVDGGEYLNVSPATLAEAHRTSACSPDKEGSYEVGKQQNTSINSTSNLLYCGLVKFLKIS